MEPVAWRDIAIRAVQAGMDVVRQWVEGGDELGERRVPSAGGSYDEYVTAVDDAADAAIRRVLVDPPATGAWVVDPVDGTTNLVAGDPFVGVSVALVVDGRPAVGATGCPFTGELWSVVRGLGAYDVAGRRLEVVDRSRGARRIVLDPAVSGPRHRVRWHAVHDRLTHAFGAVELRSAITLELAYVAAGVYDGVVQIGGSPIEDFAAGVLLVEEAGGAADAVDEAAFVAGTPACRRELRQIVRG